MSDLRVDLNQLNPKDRKLNPQDRRVMAAAREFEALMIQQLFKTMRQTTKPNGIDGGSTMATYRDMMDEQTARELARGGGIGLADAIARQMLGPRLTQPSDLVKNPEARE